MYNLKQVIAWGGSVAKAGREVLTVAAPRPDFGSGQERMPEEMKYYAKRLKCMVHLRRNEVKMKNQNRWGWELIFKEAKEINERGEIIKSRWHWLEVGRKWWPMLGYTNSEWKGKRLLYLVVGSWGNIYRRDMSGMSRKNKDVRTTSISGFVEICFMIDGRWVIDDRLYSIIRVSNDKLMPILHRNLASNTMRRRSKQQHRSGNKRSS